MTKNLIVIFALIFVSQAALRSAVSDSILRAGNNGVVDLTQTASGYTAPVDFAKNSGANTNMLVSLYSSTTLFTQTCLSFGAYFCSQYSTCSRDQSKTFTVNYPSFSAQGNIANTVAILDYSSWSLVAGSPTLIATACSTNNNQGLGSGANGIVGLGFEGSAQKNFQGFTSKFAVFYNKNPAVNKFQIQFNPTITANPIAKVRTNQNWIVQNIQAISLGNLKNNVNNVNVMFDINSEAIGLPISLFNTLVPAMSNFQVYCPQGALNVPVCNFNGNINFLPNIELNVDASTKLTITPQMYVNGFNGAQIQFNVKALSTTLAGWNYVTADYSNYIVLGSSFLKNVATVFNTNDRSVTVYPN